jgi:hypothetical protein
VSVRPLLPPSDSEPRREDELSRVRVEDLVRLGYPRRVAQMIIRECGVRLGPRTYLATRRSVRAYLNRQPLDDADGG